MADLLKQFRADWHRFTTLLKTGRIVVAVSGGADSIVLLDLLHEAAPELGLHLVVAHANHQLRGAESDGDEVFVQALAERFKLPCVTARLDVYGELSRTRESLEMTARRLRHAFLARTVQEYGAAVVALAHHADDQVETFFLRLFRGAGGEGLGAIKCISPSPADPRYSLIRPLLAASKHDILAYAAEHHLKFREDESNQDHALLRNRVRHELLPLLARDYSPGIYRVTLRAAELVGDDADFVRERAELWLKSKRRPIFLRLHPAMQRAVIRQQLWRLGHTGDFELIEKLRSKTVAVATGTNSALQCDREGQVTSFTPPAPLIFSPDTEVLDLSEVGGIIEFACVELNWRVVAHKDSSKPIEGKPDQEQFDADTVGRQLLLRHWRAGDRFQPLGSRNPSKLQNQFVNRKIPAARRRQLIVAETPSGELCWVEGLPPGEPFKLTAKTSRCLTLSWRHQQPT